VSLAWLQSVGRRTEGCGTCGQKRHTLILGGREKSPRDINSGSNEVVSRRLIGELSNGYIVRVERKDERMGEGRKGRKEKNSFPGASNGLSEKVGIYSFKRVFSDGPPYKEERRR